MPSKLTFGSDPETFWVDEIGSVVCPTLIAPEPKRVYTLGKHGGYNRDGLAFELNPSPTTKPDELASNMIALLEQGFELMRGARLHMSVKAEIPNDPMLPQDVWQLGCDPDHNSYKELKITAAARKSRTRFAGGHLMLGLPEQIAIAQAFDLAKFCDLYVGVPSLAFSMDGSRERRKVYGKAGSFRYRQDRNLFEYRTPDAGWLLRNWDSTDKLSNVLRRFFAGFEEAWGSVKSGKVVRQTAFEKARKQIDYVR